MSRAPDRLSLEKSMEPLSEYAKPMSMARFRHLDNPDLDVYLKGRAVPDVKFPLQHFLTSSDVFSEKGLPDLNRIQEHFQGEGRLDVDCLMQIVTGAIQIMSRENNVVYVNGTVRVIGAVCGQFFDLVEILKRVNFDEGEKCVFLGKFVWDGGFNIETLLHLYAHKIVYPDSIILLRSQRESRICSKTTFKTECHAKYNMDVYEKFCVSFEHLPLVAVVNKDTICVHGGISPRALSLADIDNIHRFEEPPPRGALTDLLWADPDHHFGNESDSTPCFTFNEERLISVYFTYEAFRNFMTRNKLSCLVRANQPLFDGFFEYPMPEQSWDMRLSMKAVFSAPNFKGKRNQGAMLVLTPSVCHVEKFLWVSSPYWLPNFMDCFTWSLPFLVRKATLFVSDLLEIMDRDTAASDLKAALKRHQERTNVLSGLAKEKGESETGILIPQRLVGFSAMDQVTEEGNYDVPSWRDVSSYDEEDEEGTAFHFRDARCRSLKLLCCPGQMDLPEDEAN